MMQIFIHGLGQTPSSWENTIKEMNIQTDVNCPNLSELLKGHKINYTNLYQVFSEYCNTFSEPLNLCGLSLGGVLALNYAIEYPERVQSLVLIGTQYKMPKMLLRFQNIIFRFMPNSMFEQMGFGKKDFIELSRSMMELDFSNDLKKISCPVFVVCGEKDNANKKASIGLNESLSNSEIQIVDGSGHEVNIDRPKQLGDVINDFYKRNGIC